MVAHTFCFTAEIVHTTSIWITSIPSVQRALAIALSYWSRIHIKMTRKFWRRMTGLVFVISVLICALFYHSLWVSTYERGEMCCLQKAYFFDEKGVKIRIADAVFFITFVLIFVSTIVIVCKLTCFRSKIQRNSTAVERKSQISAFTVVVICTIFMSLKSE